MKVFEIENQFPTFLELFQDYKNVIRFNTDFFSPYMNTSRDTCHCPGKINSNITLPTKKMFLTSTT